MRGIDQSLMLDLLYLFQIVFVRFQPLAGVLFFKMMDRGVSPAMPVGLIVKYRVKPRKAANTARIK